jgi:hypothetical protein
LKPWAKLSSPFGPRKPLSTPNKLCSLGRAGGLAGFADFFKRTGSSFVHPHHGNSLDSIRRQETAHPLDCQVRVPNYARLIGENEQFAKMNHGSAGFESADHSKVILKTV